MTDISINISAAGCCITKEVALIKEILNKNGYNIDVQSLNEKCKEENAGKNVTIICDYNPWIS